MTTSTPLPTAPTSPNGQTPTLAAGPPLAGSSAHPAVAPGGTPPPVRDSPKRDRLSVRVRLPQVRDLAARGHTRAQIARTLGVSPRTVTADVARLATLQEQEFARRVGRDGRLHALDVHRLLQASAWKAVDAILDNQTDAYRNLAPLLRTIALSQHAMDGHHTAQRDDDKNAARMRDWRRTKRQLDQDTQRLTRALTGIDKRL